MKFRLLLLLVASVVVAAPLKVVVVSDQDSIGASLKATLVKGGAEVIQNKVPEANDLNQADVALLYQTDFKPYSADAQKALADFAKKGHGLVVVHGALAGLEAGWSKENLGASWNADSQKFHDITMMNLRTDSHPLTQSMSTFDVTDDTVYDLTFNDKVFVLCSSFTPKVTNSKKKVQNDRISVYDIEPQWWALEAAAHRAAVLLQGDAQTLQHPSVVTYLKRAVAWTAHRTEVNELCNATDLADLRYPVGGPRRPNDAIAQFKLQPGFKTSVLCSEPLINKPIAIQWDEKGRLWVAETPEYPNGRRPLTADSWKETGVLVPGSYDRPAQDKISVLIDSQHRGVFDKKVIFHEGLELITGFCFYRDGVIAVAQNGIYWLRDTKGTGKADQEILLYGGFRPGDTHFVPNHFIVAPDGWIYASNGGGALATNGKTGELMAKISPGTFRFKPDGSAIEQVASQGGNSFGNEVTSDLELYHGKATNGNPVQHVVLPETILAKVPGTNAKAFHSVNPGRPVARTDMPDRAPLMQIDQVGHYSAGCACSVYEGGAWPKEYNGTVWMTEPILDVIHHEKLNLNGVTYEGELQLQGQEWLRSMDQWFCPIDVSFGPDGAMYILDFYTAVVAHNDTRGPMHSKSGASVRPDREHYFGRIYRIQHDQAPSLVHPDLTTADAMGLVEAFKHPSKVVRFNAIRVLMDRDAATQQTAVAPLVELAQSQAIPEARIQALWALQRLGKLDQTLLAQAAKDSNASIRKNAFLIAEAGKIALPTAIFKAGLSDENGRVRLATLRAMGTAPLSADAGTLLLESQKTFTDDWSKAAASAAAASNPVPTIEALLSADTTPQNINEVSGFLKSLSASLAGANDPAGNLRALAAAAKCADGHLATIVLRELADRRAVAPTDRASTQALLQTILGIKDIKEAGAGASLTVAWGFNQALQSELNTLGARLIQPLQDSNLSNSVRATAGITLVALRDNQPSFAKAIHDALLAADTPEEVKRAVIDALVATNDVKVGSLLIETLPKTSGILRNSLFAALVTRTDWAQLILNALEAKNLSPLSLGPIQISQLTRHPDDAVSKRAAAVLAKLNAGSNPAKDEIINRLRPLVEEKAGDPAKGKELFTSTCAVCHKVGEVGNEFGPNLQGIGSHPVVELLVHIIDPSRMVDDEHRTWNFKTKDGTLYSAIIASENNSVVKLRQPGGIIIELKQSDIASRQRIETSLMPEGFEALGAEGLRNIIAYLKSVAVTANGITVGRFQLLNLSNAFTADTRWGLYASRQARSDTLPFIKFGQITANGIPFEVIDPAQAKDGKNVIVLKGGGKGTFAHSLAQKVEIPVGTAATRLHLLGAVGGWGSHGDGQTVAMTVDIHFLDGKTQSVKLYANRDFTDYFGRDGNVPGSKLVEGVLKDHQVRTLVIPVENVAVIEKVVLSSPDNEVAPTTVAITAEIGGDPNPPRKESKPAAGKKAVETLNSPNTTMAFGQHFAARQAGMQRVLLLGAGSSHDFPKFFLGQDAATIKATGKYDTVSSPNLAEALALLPMADLLVFSGNHAQYGTPEFQSALNAFADAGKGIVIVHAGAWYNWPAATNYNDRFVAGGARGHGHSEFAVTVTKPEHPILQGVPGTFKIMDESYQTVLSHPENAEILATLPGPALKGQPGPTQTFPTVWIVKDSHTRIVNITLGHALEAHSNPAYQTILLNALQWVSQK